MKRYLIALILLIVIAFASYIALPYTNRLLGLPNISSLTEYEPISSIEIYDYRDKFIGFLQAKEDRQVVALKDISPYLRRAVLAIEDKNFYDHCGVDVIAIIRAFFVNLQAGKIVEGGSTVTQQLVKNLLIPEKERGRTFSRKFKELLLALELERRYKKDRILELYLNQVYWGNRAFGIQRAAQRYFNKSSTELNLEEAAYLAGLLKAPSAFAVNKRAAKKRKNLVLRNMLQFGYITKNQYQKAIRSKLEFSSSPGQFELYPYYFSYVLEELKTRFDMKRLNNKGFKVYTSLDPEAQRKAEAILNEEIEKAPNGVTQFALAAIDVESAQIRALVGGVGNFWENQWNRATNPHTIGSAFKPFVYITAFETGLIRTQTKIKDSKVEIDDGSEELWTPKNFDDKFWGTITVREALTFSRNLPAVKIAKKLGIERVIETAKACGINSKLEPNLSVALGSNAISPLEAATAYATFARGGIYMKPILIRKIKDPQGRIIEKNNPIPKRAISSHATAQLVSILQDVVKRGTGALARLEDRAVAGKTGTSDKSRDVWFIGFTPDLSVAIWGGNDENKAIKSKWVTGGAIVARVWKKFAEEYYKDKDLLASEFPEEPKMKALLVDPLTGLLATPYTSNPVKKLFVPGTEPKEYAPVPPGVNKFSKLKRLFYGPFRHKDRFQEDKEIDHIVKRRDVFDEDEEGEDDEDEHSKDEEQVSLNIEEVSKEKESLEKDKPKSIFKRRRRRRARAQELRNEANIEQDETSSE